jgi:hypothetical protein
MQQNPTNQNRPDILSGNTPKEALMQFSPQKNIFRMFISGILAIFMIASLTACKSSGDEKTPDPTTGVIQVSVSGLPSGAKPSGAILGPKGYNKLLSGAETLSSLEPGAYEVMMYLADAEGKKYIPSKSQQIIVDKGTTKKAEFSYELEKYHFPIRIDGLETETRAEQGTITGGFDRVSSYTGTYPTSLNWKQTVNGAVTASGST